MKNKVSAAAKMAIPPLLGVAFCVFLYVLVDDGLNGVFVDWFSKNFIWTSIESDYLTGSEIITTHIDWWKVKNLLLGVLIVVIIIVILLVMTVSRYYAEKKEKESITKTSNMIREFMEKKALDANEVFPQLYAEIASQMVQVKADMQRQKQVLRDELRRKEDLITYLAHDLKTPLTSVIGYLNLLNEVTDMPASQRENYIRIALDKANRLEQLINEFFEITRYNLQQIVIEKECIDLYYMLVQMTDEFYPVLAADRNSIELICEEDLIIYGDPAKLARVFNNILKNAVAYSYPRTTVKIEASVIEDNKIIISFQNQGKTIPKQKLDAIFEKFFRLDDARVSNTGGAGLGLAIAKDIVALHDGDISVVSKEELTTFYVILPCP